MIKTADLNAKSPLFPPNKQNDIALAHCPKVKKSVFFLYLEASVQSALDGDAFGGVGAVGGDGRDEAVQLVPLLLQLLHEALDRALGERLGLTALQ